MKRSFRPITYEAWREQALVSRSPDDEVDCPDCGGEGDTECCECGHERECDTCDGTGQTTWEELTEAQKNRLLTLRAYESAVLADAQAWARWLGTDSAQELAHAGFRVWSSVSSRQLHAAAGSQGGLQ